ncbi:unnamed protein product [Alopecurus aequalis]
MGEESGAGDIISYDHHAPVVVCKGKRSKRQRVHAAPPPPAPLPDVVVIETESSSSVAEDDGWRSGADQEAASGCVTEEEEDMAHCLMLLARGGGRGAQAGPSSSSSSLVAVAKEGKFRSRRPADGADGEFVYECKTCGRCFPSFQALGGHRTSHKKPRLLLPPTSTSTTTTTGQNKQRPASEEKSRTPSARPSAEPTVPVLAIPATPPKQESAAAISGASRQQQPKLGSRAHECTICGAEFASGQALGGHMRRHRPLVPASASSDADVAAAAAVIGAKEKALLELDLNMPAPCDEAVAETTSTAAGFALLFPAPASSALVDCHY